MKLSDDPAIAMLKHYGARVRVYDDERMMGGFLFPSTFEGSYDESILPLTIVFGITLDKKSGQWVYDQDLGLISVICHRSKNLIDVAKSVINHFSLETTRPTQGYMVAEFLQMCLNTGLVNASISSAQEKLILQPTTSQTTIDVCLTEDHTRWLLLGYANGLPTELARVKDLTEAYRFLLSRLAE